MTSEYSEAAPNQAASTTAPTLLYRFRPLGRLLDSGELERQEIYFASPEELNDPMEGYRDLFWSGDRIAWENLFKHYLRCLNWALTLYRLGGEEHLLGWNNIPVVGPRPGEPGSPALDAMLHGVFDDFLGEPTVARLLDFLDSRASPTRRDELRSYVRCLHPLALGIVWRRHGLHGLAQAASDSEEMLTRARLTLPSLDRVIETTQPLSDDGGDDVVRALFALFEEFSGQVGLNMLMDLGEGMFEANKDFLIRAFGEEFVDQLERLVYPDTRVACFLSDCRDSSLWGTYGDSHAGVCLMFKPVVEGGRLVLPLTRVNGFGPNGPSSGRVAHEFHRVQYSSKFPPLDFFRSIGTLPVGMLFKHWHSNPQGVRSVCASDYGDQWREGYWKAFYPGATTKLADWEREREYRLLLTSSLHNFSDVESRKATYDFADLHGLIFGMKTPLRFRLDICRIVAAKCRASGRSDFKFYEAFYSEARGAIDHRELNLLRLGTSEVGGASPSAESPP